MKKLRRNIEEKATYFIVFFFISIILEIHNSFDLLTHLSIKLTSYAKTPTNTCKILVIFSVVLNVILKRSNKSSYQNLMSNFHVTFLKTTKLWQARSKHQLL